MRYRNFFTTQLHYLQYKATRGLDISTAMPIHFGFDGEYSVVADPAGGMVDFVVKLVARQIQAVLGLQFQSVVCSLRRGPQLIVDGWADQLVLPWVLKRLLSADSNASTKNISLCYRTRPILMPRDKY